MHQNFADEAQCLPRILILPYPTRGYSNVTTLGSNLEFRIAIPPTAVKIDFTIRLLTRSLLLVIIVIVVSDSFSM